MYQLHTNVRHCSKGDFPKDFIKKKLIKVDEQ